VLAGRNICQTAAALDVRGQELQAELSPGRGGSGRSIDLFRRLRRRPNLPFSWRGGFSDAALGRRLAAHADLLIVRVDVPAAAGWTPLARFGDVRVYRTSVAD
jgi:hypothetical protein